MEKHARPQNLADCYVCRQVNCQTHCHLNSPPDVAFPYAAPNPTVISNPLNLLRFGSNDSWAPLATHMTPFNPFAESTVMATELHWPEDCIRRHPSLQEKRSDSKTPHPQNPRAARGDNTALIINTRRYVVAKWSIIVTSIDSCFNGSCLGHECVQLICSIPTSKRCLQIDIHCRDLRWSSVGSNVYEGAKECKVMHWNFLRLL